MFYKYENVRPPLLPLPRCEGPKLEPFSVNDDVDIEFISPIASGGQADIWKVAIQGRVYALKMFRLLSPGQSSDIAGYASTQPQSVLEGQGLSFHCECRAYGRLKETGREALAVKAHGYVLLTTTQRKNLLERHSLDWNPYRHPAPENFRIPAIVKDYVDPGFHFEPKMAPRMRHQLLEFHKVGILLNDVKRINYLNGVFCDFGNSWTVPHFMLDETLHPGRLKDIQEDARADLIYFDVMVDKWNEEFPHKPIWERCLSNFDYHGKLRGGLSRRTEWPLKCLPSKYDWKAAQRARTAQQRTTTERQQESETEKRGQGPVNQRKASKPAKASARPQEKRSRQPNRVQKSTRTTRHKPKRA